MIRVEPNLNSSVCIFSFVVESADEKSWVENNIKRVYDAYTEKYFHNCGKTDVHTFEQYLDFSVSPCSHYYGTTYHRSSPMDEYIVRMVCCEHFFDFSLS